MSVTMRFRVAFCVILMCCAACSAVEGKAAMAVKLTQSDGIVVIDNGIVSLRFDTKTTTFSARAGGKTFISEGRLSGKGGQFLAFRIKDELGTGCGLDVGLAGGAMARIRVYAGLGFIVLRTDPLSPARKPAAINKITPVSLTVELGKSPSALKTLGCDGLLGGDRERTVHAFLAAADPASRAGVVAGWLTHNRASGVVTVKPDAGALRIEGRSEYGKLLLRRGVGAEGELFAVGYFPDALDGLEQFADAIARANGIKLPPVPSGYCTWYSRPHGGASDEKAMAQMAAFCKKELTRFGFGVIQIDDKWQISGRDFTTHRSNGPYPGGMKLTADRIRAGGMRAGIWYIPFGWDPKRPAFKGHQDWFVKRSGSGELYKVRWAGTCLDMTNPAARKFLARCVSRMSKEWGYKYFKIDGLWTGLAAKITYPSPVYREDNLGDAVFHDPSKTNVEAYRSGLALVRKSAGKGVYILGCNIAQNMRTLGASFGRVDGMRVGRDISANWGKIIPCMQMGSRLYFLHGRVWHNDPDCLMLRKPLTLDQARAWASWISISGQLNMVSEWLPGLPADRLDILKRSMPNHGLCGRPVDLFETPNPRVWKLTARAPTRRDVVGLFNWKTSAPARISVDLRKLDLPAGPAATYVGFDYWADKFVPPFAGTLTSELAPGSCRVIALRAVQDHPVLIGTSRHITQGVIDVQAEAWDAASNTLAGASSLVAGDPYELRIFAPKHTVVAAEATAAGGALTARVSSDGPNVRVKFTSDAGGAVKWKVLFGRSRS